MNEFLILATDLAVDQKREEFLHCTTVVAFILIKIITLASMASSCMNHKLIIYFNFMYFLYLWCHKNFAPYCFACVLFEGTIMKIIMDSINEMQQ